MAGNTLGPRASYHYISDSNVDYCILTDETLGDAAGLTKAVGHPQVPRKFKPRGVWAEAVISGKKVRKFLPCQGDSTLYLADASQNVTIDTVTFKTTGKRGEKMSFLTN